MLGRYMGRPVIIAGTLLIHSALVVDLFDLVVHIHSSPECLSKGLVCL